MKFTLFYDGALKAKGDKNHKHIIRKEFHKQLKELWRHEPLCGDREYLEIVKKEVGNVFFVPLVTKEFRTTAEIHITLLRPGPPGKIYYGGDIDNRLKTLLDALKIPKKEELPSHSPEEDEEQFFTLLEDDALITNISINTDRLLIADADKKQSEVRLMLNVNIIKVFARLNGIA